MEKNLAGNAYQNRSSRKEANGMVAQTQTLKALITSFRAANKESMRPSFVGRFLMVLQLTCSWAAATESAKQDLAKKARVLPMDMLICCSETPPSSPRKDSDAFGGVVPSSL